MSSEKECSSESSAKNEGCDAVTSSREERLSEALRLNLLRRKSSKKQSSHNTGSDSKSCVSKNNKEG